MSLSTKLKTNLFYLFRWTQLFYGAVDEGVGVSELEDSAASLDSSVQIDQGFCNWLVAIFKIKYARETLDIALD